MPFPSECLLECLARHRSVALQEFVQLVTEGVVGFQHKQVVEAESVGIGQAIANSPPAEVACCSFRFSQRGPVGKPLPRLDLYDEVEIGVGSHQEIRDKRPIAACSDRVSVLPKAAVRSGSPARLE